MSFSINNTHSHIAPAFKAMNPITFLFAMAAVARQRRALSALPDHLLGDIGLSNEDAQTEARRAPWDVPANWRA